MFLKKIALLCSLVVLSFSLVACSSPSSQSSESSTDDSAETNALTVDDAIEMGGFYKLNSDGQSAEYLDYSTVNVVSNSESDLIHNDAYLDLNALEASPASITGDRNLNMWVYSGGLPTTINATNGESLIVIGQETPTVFMWPVVEKGYYQGDGVEGAPSEYAEIEGIVTEDKPLTETSNALEGIGIYCNSYSGEGDKKFLQATNQTTLSASWYDGTEYSEGSINITTPYYVALHSSQNSDIDLSKTTEGYFSVDLSNLNPGFYVMTTYDPEVTSVIQVA